MIDQYTIHVIENSKISNQEIDGIIRLKSQHWEYPEDSQKKWIKDNLSDDDFHLWIENSDRRVIAYLNMIHLEAIFDNKKMNIIGVGNVCVEKELAGKGIGKLLMSVGNYYINQDKSKSILLCKKSLREFYMKCGWEEFVGETSIRGEIFRGSVMLNFKSSENKIVLLRNF